MKLLFDQNLSFKLCRLLVDIFPDSNQIRLLGMAEVSDRDIWEIARIQRSNRTLTVGV
jgi:predicted nuclease of predicted toxin-antitoxin system